jgi:uncharacterized Zn-finger protein
MKCIICNLIFQKKCHAQEHGFYKHGKKIHRCEDCGEYFSFIHNLRRHQRDKICLKRSNGRVSVETADSVKYFCSKCSTRFTRKDNLQKHQAIGCSKRKKKNVSQTTDSLTTSI